jgi:hypothetical protein
MLVDISSQPLPGELSTVLRVVEVCPQQSRRAGPASGDFRLPISHTGFKLLLPSAIVLQYERLDRSFSLPAVVS